MTPDPFSILGLPVQVDLTDDDVRVAWRRVAAATHPDRDDGGDPARFAAAAAAYTGLRTRYGRGEAYADLTRPPQERGEIRATPPSPAPAAQPGPAVASGGRAGFGLAGLLVWRIRRGRPAVLGLRLAIAAAISAVSFVVVGAQPAAGGLTTGAVTWFLLTARRDLAPPDR
jgi:hypothetical protein